jgi:hypothetical protein
MYCKPIEEEFMKKLLAGLALIAAFVFGFVARGVVPAETVAYAQGGRVFELRTYTVPDSAKLDLLHTRFRNQTGRFFQRHGMVPVWYGKVMDAPGSQTTMVYMLSHANRDAAKKSWDAFRADQEWAAVAKESGVGAVKIDAVFLEPTDYSPMK